MNVGVAIVNWLGTAGTAAVYGTNVAAVAATATTFWGSVAAAAINVTLLTVASSAFAPKPGQNRSITPKQSLSGRAVNSRVAIGYRQYVYGQVRVGGQQIFIETTGTDNKYLHFIIVHAAHECEEVGDLYIDDEIVPLTGNAAAVGSKYRGFLNVYTYDGSPTQTHNTQLAADTPLKWTDEHDLRGIAYTYCRLSIDTENNVWPGGIPSISRVIKGRKVYDPRIDSTAYSANSALCTADFLTSEFGYGRYGLTVTDSDATSDIDVTSLEAAANVCDEQITLDDNQWITGTDVSIGTKRTSDTTPVKLYVATTDGTTGVTAPTGTGDDIDDGGVTWNYDSNFTNTESRYRTNGTVRSSDTPMSVVKKLKSSMAGFVEYIGDKWFIHAGAYRAPSITLSEGDFRGGINGQTQDDRRTNTNRVRGVFSNAGNDFNVVEFPAVTNSTYLTEDREIEAWREVDFAFTTSAATAQRLAKIQLERARQQITHTARFSMKAMQIQPGDTFNLKFEKYGYGTTGSHDGSENATILTDTSKNWIPDSLIGLRLVNETDGSSGVVSSNTDTTITATLSGGAFDWDVGDVYVLAKSFSCTSHKLVLDAGALVCEMSFRETSSAVYTWANGEETVLDPAPNSNLPNPFSIAAPTNLTAASGTAQLVTVGDVVQSRIRFNFDVAAEANVQSHEIKWRKRENYSISAITTTNPAVLTTTAEHTLEDGDIVTIWQVSGMTEIIGIPYIVANSNPALKTVELSNCNSTSFTTYSGPTGWIELDWESSVTIAAPSSQFLISDVEDGYAYDIEVRAINALTKSDWVVLAPHTVIGKTAAPADPVAPTVSAVANGVSVQFGEHPDLDFLQYQIWVQESSSAPTHTGTGAFSPAPTTTTSDRSKTITGLDPDLTYYVFTAAKDSSRLLSEIVATTPATISPLSVSADSSLGALAIEDDVNLGIEGNGGVKASTVLPVANTEATDNGATIDTSGDVNAAIDFTASGAIKHGKTSSDDASNAGFWLGKDGQVTPNYDFHIGNSTNSLKWDGSASTLEVKGDLKGGSSITIGTGLDEFKVTSAGLTQFGGRITFDKFGAAGAKAIFSGNSVLTDNDIGIYSYMSVETPAKIVLGDSGGFINGAGNAKFKTLYITTSLDLDSSTLDASNGVGTSGQVLSSTGSATQWINAPGGGSGTVTGTGTLDVITAWDTGGASLKNSALTQSIAAGASTMNFSSSSTASSSLIIENSDTGSASIADIRLQTINSAVEADAQILVNPAGYMNVKNIQGVSAIYTDFNTHVFRGNSGTVKFAKLTTEGLRIGDDATATAKLDVIGTGKFSSTVTATGDFIGNELRCRTGQQLVIQAGESYISSGATGQTNELVYLNAEGGVEISSSSDNWVGAWSTRYSTKLGSSGPKLEFGIGGSYDTNLYRSSANVLKTDDSFTAVGTVTASNLSGTNTGDQSASEILTAIKTVDGAGSGLDADLLDGQNASVSAGNNTIVQRHASGYIFANYFNTTPNTVTSGVTQVCVETGNDGYIRHGTAAAIRTFLGVESGATADQTITLSGDATGSGTGSIAVTVANDSHNHSQVYIPDTRGAIRAPSYYPDRFVSYDFQNKADTLAGDDDWHVLQTVAKWSSWNAVHTQQQIAYTGPQLKHREATSDTVWGAWKTLWDSSNDGSGSGLDADTVDGIEASQFLRSDTASPQVSGQLYVGNSTSSYIWMVDTDHGNRAIHCNSNNIGFLNSSNGWGAYCTDAGLWHCDSGLSVNGNATVTGNVGIGTTAPAAAAKLTVMGNQTFGLPGSGANSSGRFISIEGNADSGGEGSGRVFFTEHNSSTANMDNYGMSLGYRGGSTSIVGASGNTWTGLTQIGNGEWGMFGHNGSASGVKIMQGSRSATYTAHYSSGSETMRVTGGNVGIGTTAPSASLHVDAPSTTSNSLTYGAAAGQIFTNENAELAFGLLNASPYPLYIQGRNHTNGAKDIVLQSLGGKVGIGKTAPASLLHLASTGPAILTIEADTDNASETDNARIVLSQDGGAVVGRVGFANNTNSLEVINQYAENLYLGTGNSTDFTINSSGHCVVQRRLYVGNSSSYFFTDTGSRTCYTGGDLYIQSGVGNYYNYATHQYLGSTSGDNVYLRGNPISGNDWRLEGTGTFRGNISDGSHTSGNAGYWPGYHNHTYGYDFEATTTGTTLHLGRQSGTAGQVLNIGADANAVLVSFRNTDSASSGVATRVGWIAISASATGYNSASDYRLKENSVGITDGITRLKQLSPIRFNFIAEPEKTVDGFLAHEVSDVIPEAISGEKDAMEDEEYEISPATYNQDGELVGERVMGTRSVPNHQGIDQSKLVPLLTAALQEAITKIEENAEQIAALKTLVAALTKT